MKLHIIIIIFFSICSVNAQSYWKNDISGSWNKSSNWTPTGSPNTVGANVTLGNVISQQRTINLTSSRTVGTLNFNSSNTYRIKDSTIKWNNTGSSNAEINVAANQEHYLDSASALRDNLSVNVSDNSTLSMGGAFSGSKDIIKNGNGNLNFDLAGVSASTGNLVINSGRVIMERTSTDGSFRGNSIVLNSGGTLLLSQSNQIKDTTGMIMNGGTLETGVLGSDTVGALTLVANSIINLAAISDFDLFFANSMVNIWNGLLTINNWTGDQSGGIGGRLFFGNNNTSLTNQQLSQVQFNGFGTGAILLTNGELVPNMVPEARVVIAGLMVFSIFLYRELNSRRKSYLISKQT